MKRSFLAKELLDINILNIFFFLINRPDISNRHNIIDYNRENDFIPVNKEPDRYTVSLGSHIKYNILLSLTDYLFW